MTAATVSTPAAVTPAPDPSSKVLDAILAGGLVTLTRPADNLPAVVEQHPLVTVEDVKAAMPIIQKMMEEEAEGKGKKVYPRALLRHQHIAAFMLVNPFATTTEVCAFFGIGPSTLANIAKSDTFQALVEQHRLAIENHLGGDLQQQLRDTLKAAIEVTQKAVVTGQDPEYALAVLDKTANRLGMGAKHNTNVQINNNIVTPEMIAAAREARTKLAR